MLGWHWHLHFLTGWHCYTTYDNPNYQGMSGMSNVRLVVKILSWKCQNCQILSSRSVKKKVLLRDDKIWSIPCCNYIWKLFLSSPYIILPWETYNFVKVISQLLLCNSSGSASLNLIMLRTKQIGQASPIQLFFCCCYAYCRSRSNI